ncbi:hypothetical protein BV898_04039 [Hypsibius exemplaris]|uniref:G-protein coupled receptors family 3 profile domain-containing protein n=1 Tax=Hypsibius exemplaris TaxID=2072580 RepID=A0A1W0X445_HYPEX|nr:hypothetical protein BV898_04039 [Hypsibius exemplaris]
MAAFFAPIGFRDEIWVTVLIVLASIGLVITLGLWVFTLYKIIRLDIKTRNLWLSQVLLLFVCLSYGTCFIWIPTPNTATCAAIRFLPGVCYAGLFAGLLLKTLNIITEARHVYVPGYVQVTLFTALVTVQLVIGSQWLILVPPAVVVFVYDNGSERLLCSSSLEEIILSFVYLLLLVFVLCVTTSAARRRTVIHREEAFLLSVCVGFIIPIWVAWSLLGTVGTGRLAYEDPCLAFGLLATTSLVLILVFLPRARRLSKLSRTLHHVTFGEAQYAIRK